MSEFIILANAHAKMDLEVSIFPGGEISVKLDTTYHSPKSFYITAKITDSEGIMTLLMIKDALERQYPETKHYHLNLPYLPYARQDRVCNKGEALSIKVFTNLINSMKFDRVVILDCHSDVGVALLDNCSNVAQDEIFDSQLWNAQGSGEHTSVTTVLVSPDAGANKKVNKLAQKYNLPVIRADKVRDVATGKITGTVVFADDLSGTCCLIVDDICDGGRTFIELAKVLKAKGAESVVLMVTHGIFSKGLIPIFDSGINRIITTDSVCNLDPKEYAYHLEVVKC